MTSGGGPQVDLVDGGEIDDRGSDGSGSFDVASSRQASVEPIALAAGVLQLVEQRVQVARRVVGEPADLGHLHRVEPFGRGVAHEAGHAGCRCCQRPASWRASSAESRRC